MGAKQGKGGHRRFYDSYRPARNGEASLEKVSRTIATKAPLPLACLLVNTPPSPARHQNKQAADYLLRAKFDKNSTPPGNASSILGYSPGHPKGHSLLTTSISIKTSPFSDHDPGQLRQTPTKERKLMNMPDTAPSQGSPRTLEPHTRIESEAQSRGIYGSARSPTSNVMRLGRYELKRPLDDEATDLLSVKRRRDAEEEEKRPISVSDNHRPPRNRCCMNYMCLEDHAYADCNKQRICWGCRSTGHYWPSCLEVCTRCGKDRHTAKYCEDFEPTPSGESQPRARNWPPPTEPAAERARKGLLKPAHGEDSRPEKFVKVIVPIRDGSERGQASRNVHDPRAGSRQTSQSQRSANTSTPSTSEQLSILTETPEKVSSPSLTPAMSSRDPRLRRESALTPVESPLQSMQMSLEPGEILSAEPRMLEEMPNPPQLRQQEDHQSRSPSQRGIYTSQYINEDEGNAPQASGRTHNHHLPPRIQDEYYGSYGPKQIDNHSSRSPTRDEGHPTQSSTPGKDPSHDSLATIDARMKAFEEEDRIRQKEHEEELARKKRQQSIEFEAELEGKINQKRHEGEMARRAALQKQEEEHERRLAELRRR